MVTDDGADLRWQAAGTEFASSRGRGCGPAKGKGKWKGREGKDSALGGPTPGPLTLFKSTAGSSERLAHLRGSELTFLYFSVGVRVASRSRCSSFWRRGKKWRRAGSEGKAADCLPHAIFIFKTTPPSVGPW
jgi:hypothetical protein